ncbi:MAG: HNH endonuclease [Acidobacteria bacterium]|nr:HNH endonuclease [Acidobacteriota bacterium]MCA1641968.1 HNH endonuclease [Acidobacteriota bacterium]
MYCALVTSNGGSHTHKEWLEKLARYNRCPRCNRLWSEVPRRPNLRYKSVWTKDHIIPITDGGTSDIANIQPLCYSCNFSKCNEKRWRRVR